MVLQIAILAGIIILIAIGIINKMTLTEAIAKVNESTANDAAILAAVEAVDSKILALQDAFNNAQDLTPEQQAAIDGLTTADAAITAAVAKADADATPPPSA